MVWAKDRIDRAKALRLFESRKTQQHDKVQAQGEESDQ